VWGLGHPWSLDVWNSVHYSETTFTFANIPEVPVTDARGEDASGKHWRIIGRFGESIKYREADAETAAVLDKFLDGVCLASVN
jgi:hypothetical protein